MTFISALRPMPGSTFQRLIQGIVVGITIACMGSACIEPNSAPEVELEVRRSETSVADKEEPANSDAPTEGLVQGEVSEAEEDDGYHVGALETYRYWAGRDPDEDTRVLNGQYWSSAHWTKEYTMYLEFRSPWVKNFAAQNGLKRAEQRIEVPSGGPDWFKPSKKLEVWTGEQGSLYYIDPKAGHIFIYEMQM